MEIREGQKAAVNGKEYEILKLLGKGKGGYSYLAAADGRKVVLKQIHHEPCSYYQFGNKIQAELNDYRRLQKIGICMPEMLDVDMEHERIIKEFVDGETVYDLVLADSLPETCLEQMKAMCARLYGAGTNIDYFPTNFILQDNVLYYIDYECNDYMDEWNFENWGIKYWSKTPEFLQYANDHREKKSNMEAGSMTAEAPEKTADESTYVTESETLDPVWQKLYDEARKVQKARAISPYIEAGQVAAALLTKSGNIYVGVCIDTACTLGMCAERNAIANMITNGESRIDKILAVMADGKAGPPCGACREFMMQLDCDSGEIEIMLDLETGRTARLKELLPDWWGRMGK